MRPLYDSRTKLARRGCVILIGRPIGETQPGWSDTMMLNGPIHSAPDPIGNEIAHLANLLDGLADFGVVVVYCREGLATREGWIAKHTGAIAASTNRLSRVASECGDALLRRHGDKIVTSIRELIDAYLAVANECLHSNATTTTALNFIKCWNAVYAVLYQMVDLRHYGTESWWVTIAERHPQYSESIRNVLIDTAES
jgi:hypothetical protein